MKPEEQAVSFEIARALQEAGWPQDPGHNYFYWRAVNFEESAWRLVSPHMVLDRAYRPKIAAPTAAELGEALPEEIHLRFKNQKPRRYAHYLVIRRCSAASAWDVKYVSSSSYEDLTERAGTEADARAKMWLLLRGRNLLPV